MVHTTLSLGGTALRDTLSLTAQVMSELDGNDEFMLHASQAAGHAEMTDVVAEVVLTAVARILAVAGSLEAYWEGITPRGIPLYECADAIAHAMRTHGLDDLAALGAAAGTACVALLAIPRSADAGRQHG